MYKPNQSGITIAQCIQYVIFMAVNGSFSCLSKPICDEVKWTEISDDFSLLGWQYIIQTSLNVTIPDHKLEYKSLYKQIS